MKITLGLHLQDLTYSIIKALCIAIVNILRWVHPSDSKYALDKFYTFA